MSSTVTTSETTTATSEPKPARIDVYERVTNRIVEQLEQGVRPWMKPWNAEHAAGRITRPLRFNGLPYSGINILMLWAEAEDKAYYTITHDYIRMPFLETFRDAEAHAATMAHELCHWTRHPKRLDRDLGRKRFGDEGYAMEELVAELGSAFLCADLNITPDIRNDHAEYLATWLQVLKNDKRAIFTAASHASKAVEFMHGLQITKLHRPVREPEPGGLVERVFQTIGSQFISEVECSKKTYTLTELNQAFFAYLDTTYHRTVHSQTGQAPLDRYFSQQRIVRPVAIESVQAYFFERVIRKVDSTHSDVSIDGPAYRVDPRWRGMKVYVQYDPYRIDGDSPDEVAIYNELDVYLGTGTRWNRERGGNERGFPSPRRPELPERSAVIEAYLNDHQRRQSEAQQGIDYRSAMRRGQLTLWSFGSLVGKVLGQIGGLSSFSLPEQLSLETFFQKHPQVRSLHVQEAAKKAVGEGFASLLWNLQLLLEGEPS